MVVIELTGIIAETDTFKRLRLCIVSSSQRGDPDYTWRKLRAAVPYVPKLEGAHAVPYRLDESGRPDAAGVIGECWVHVPKGPAGLRRLGLIEELRGKEVVIEVQPKKYKFRSTAEHNYGKEVTGTSLHLVSGPAEREYS